MNSHPMIDYQDLITGLDTLGAQHSTLKHWAAQLPAQIAEQLSLQRWGDLPQWQQSLNQLPTLTASSGDFKQGVAIGRASDCSEAQREQLREALMALHPWRKGPYELFGVDIDTEWRSDWKWERLLPHIAPLQDKLVLDIGCGNGYHCWRMYGEGAQRVIGIDPSPRFVYQFYALKSFTGALSTTPLPVDVLPLGIEHLPRDLKAFDTVFSMGVLYHRRSPIDHLLELKACLKNGGQLVLETLVIEGDEGEVLVPEGRYAKMRNVWFIPSPATLLSWLRKCGFKKPRLVDVCDTSADEQRSTAWMHFESLPDFLDPDDSTRTFEGHPAPRRAVFVAEC
ncbi:MAG: tRNA 5-methoxyuridine(34)/uridine 5-oxyacetic acid(34) synthase CmoB [Gammaproteobacteria bacterium]|nr:tRNA 5-methoxyuridine(34)/uridine 5-oxyacetic acid(34) synthase CmoB [Gammaproteobacteria bacterium]MBQ0839668.1 tRNA 5-methoxyuridine(34)/uridine 5-oxyacetic acid(34) synthase CmoB [Gammaproteobacteria bacterium]